MGPASTPYEGKVPLPAGGATGPVTANVAASGAYQSAFRQAVRDGRINTAIDLLRQAGFQPLRQQDELLVFVPPNTKAFRSSLPLSESDELDGPTVRYRVVRANENVDTTFDLPASIPVKFLNEARLK